MTKMYKAAVAHMLDEVHEYAMAYSGCSKVAVGSAIAFKPEPDSAIYGANVTLPYNCKTKGCLRVEKYGENSKSHRSPEDCRAVHSEIDAICHAASRGVSVAGKSIFITRYPCEACARAIVDAGIRTVVYGRQQECSEETMKIFSRARVNVFHARDWDAPDVTY